jgi:hypothetical protein
MDSEQRREAVMEAIRVGIVPREQPRKVWAGVGTDKRCAVCGARLRASDIEFELEFASGLSIVVDRQCHSLWDQERTRA